MEQNENYIVYLILGDDDAVLYVGMTKWKLRRLTQQHFTRQGHLDPACYRDAAGIRFAECVSKEDAAAREKYLIKTLSPRYNGTHNKPGKFSFSIPFDWKSLPVDKSRLNAPLVRRQRRCRTMTNLDIPSFDVLKQNLGALLSLDCSPARINGPDPALIWLDGEKLGEIINTAWAECGSPGQLYLGHGAKLACEGLSHQDWVGYTEYAPGFDDVELRIGKPFVGVWGIHENRVPWLTAGDGHAVLDELVGFAQPWQTRIGLRSLVGTFAADLDLSVRLYNWRDKYFLTLAYLRELLHAGAKVEDRYLLLTCNLDGLLHDWFVHQSRAVGYNVAVSAADVRPHQRSPYKITSNGKRNEVECRWHREAFLAGRGTAHRLNQTVWVYRLPEIHELQIALDVELKRLLEGAVDVCYHDEPVIFQNYYEICPFARRPAPKPLTLN